MKTAADYFESLTELTTAKGFQAEERTSRVFNGQPRSWCAETSPSRAGTLTMRQTSLVLVQRSYAVSFTFIGGSEDEVNELIEKLSFGTAQTLIVVCVGRTLLSAAFEVDFGFEFATSRDLASAEVQVKGFGQECPTHTARR